jgi:2-polyprenyl-3-methyl-5-hydroxy-6-metoxy-1,4-benzoquinol methylase
MEFNKYKEFGDYHWKEYRDKTIYGLHADKVSEWVTEGETLDIGAGDGLITSLIPGAIGIDDNQLAYNLAHIHGVDVRLMSAYNIKFDSKFDNILMADVIEHLKQPDEVMSNILKVIKTNGFLFITTPPKRKNGILHDEYHYREYSPEELQEYVEKFGFRLVEPIEEKFVRLYAKFQLL